MNSGTHFKHDLTKLHDSWVGKSQFIQILNFSSETKIDVEQELHFKLLSRAQSLQFQFVRCKSKVVSFLSFRHLP